MAHNIPVDCLIERVWNTSQKEWDGIMLSGTLIDIVTQTAEDNSGDIIPVGIVLLDDGSFQCVPMEFIYRQ